MKPLRSESDFPDVTGGLVFGLLAITAPWLLAEWLGLGEQLATLLDAFGPFRLIALGVLYGLSFLVIGTALRALFLIAGLSLFSGNLVLDRGAAVATSLLRKAGGVLALVVSAPFLPLKTACESWLARLREERALRQRYREEFYQAYGSYAEFRRAFYGEDDGEKQQSTPEAPGSLEEAFALFGLPAGCDQSAFETRYRELMKQVHPDRAGPNGLATRLNEARALIRTQKGWK